MDSRALAEAIGVLRQTDPACVPASTRRPKSQPPDIDPDALQVLWAAHREGKACCPEAHANVALVVTSLEETGRRQLFRFACVTCTWSTPSFVVRRGVAMR